MADPTARELHAEVAGRGPRLVLVHGFTQTGRCWSPVADDLAHDHEVVRVDAPGHGHSAGIDADLSVGAELVAAVGGRATYVGYSMGARLVLHVAVQRADLVAGLVLVGGTAGIDDPAERAARIQRDEATARRLEAEGLDAFLETWLAQPLFARLPPEARFDSERRTNTVAGLAASLRLAGTGAQEPLWDRLDRLTMPVLVMAGADDAKFRAEAERMAAAIGPNATTALVPDAGHAAHLERPAAFLALLRRWLAAQNL